MFCLIIEEPEAMGMYPWANTLPAAEGEAQKCVWANALQA